MNGAKPIPAEVCTVGYGVPGLSRTGMFAQSPHGWVHGVPGTPYPAGRASAWHHLTPFMNNAARGGTVRLGLVLDLLELRLVVGLLVGLLARDEAPLHEVHKGRVHRLHANGAAALHSGLEL